MVEEGLRFFISTNAVKKVHKLKTLLSPAHFAVPSGTSWDIKCVDDTTVFGLIRVISLHSETTSAD